MKSCPVSGCTQPTTLATIPAPVGLATDGVNVYVTTAPSDSRLTLRAWGSVLRCPCSPAATTAGRPSRSPPGKTSPGAIAVDDTSVNWVNQGGDSIMKLTPK